MNEQGNETFIDVEESDLSVRAKNILRNLNISNLVEVAFMTERDFLNSKNCGKKTLDEIKGKLSDYNLYLGSIGEIDPIDPDRDDKIISKNLKNRDTHNPRIDIFDNIKVPFFPDSARLKNTFQQLKIKTIGDIRKNFEYIGGKNKLGKKSLRELKRYTEELIGVPEFNNLTLKKDGILTSPSFLVYLKSILREVSAENKNEIEIFLANERETLNLYYRKYADEIIQMSFDELGILKSKIEKMEFDLSVLKLGTDVLDLLTNNSTLTGVEVVRNLNNLIISLNTVPEFLVKAAREVSLLIESGAEDYKKNKIERSLADVLLGNEANVINEMIDAICIDESEYDIFMNRIAACENSRLTLAEVGLKQGVTRERIRQIEKKILENARVYLTNKFTKQKELILKTIESKTLGFGIKEFEGNEYFNDFYTDDKISPDIYLNIICKIYNLELIIFDEVLLTKKYNKNIKETKREIREFLKRSTEIFLPLDEIYNEFLIDENILKYICNKELKCESVGDDIVNKFANGQSQRQQVFEAALTFEGQFSADDVVEKLKPRGLSLKTSRIISYISVIDEIQVLDFGKYISKEKIDLSKGFEKNILTNCVDFMRHKKGIYSLHTLKEMLDKKGIRHKYLTSFTIGSILSASPEIKKIGKIRYALAEDAENLSENLIGDNLKAIFYEYGRPLPMKDVRKILVDDYGYADTTAAIFLTKTSDLVKLEDGNVSTIEYSGLDKSVVNSLIAEAQSRLVNGEVGLTSFSNLVRDISILFKFPKVTCESLLKRSSTLFVFSRLDLISNQKNPFSRFEGKTPEEIIIILNEQNIFPDMREFKKYLEEIFV